MPMRKRSKIADFCITMFFVFAMLFGIAMFCYPAFSSWWNEKAQTKVIESYNKAVGDLGSDQMDAIFARAADYNKALDKLPDPFTQYDQIPNYDAILDITGTGIIGYIDIPKLNVHLPVYHGTSPEVLNIAVGHLQGTSLPIGGAGTHAVISAHSGLPSAKLFTGLDQLTEDDRFSLSVLDEVLTYEVEQIETVLPYEMDSLHTERGRDLITLMTCTPYGINTHRLLVHAHRVDDVPAEETERNIRIPADAVAMENITALPFILAPPLVLLVIYWAVSGIRKQKRYISSYTSRKMLEE